MSYSSHGYCPHGHPSVKEVDYLGWVTETAPERCCLCKPGVVLATYLPHGNGDQKPKRALPGQARCKRTDGRLEGDFQTDKVTGVTTYRVVNFNDPVRMKGGRGRGHEKCPASGPCKKRRSK